MFKSLQGADTKLENNNQVLDVLDSCKVRNNSEFLAGPTVRLINPSTLFVLFAHLLACNPAMTGSK